MHRLCMQEYGSRDSPARAAVCGSGEWETDGRAEHRARGDALSGWYFDVATH